MPHHSDADMTVEYYDQHAASFCEATGKLDMSALYRPFLNLLPPRARILDAGCGSGRDTLACLNLGYEVTAIDGSLAMVQVTTKLTGCPALQMRFDEINWVEEFDGIWACASLLHVPRADTGDVLNRFAQAL